MDSKLVRESKFLTYILRHKPESIGLTLDPQGWASIDELCDLSKNSEISYTIDLIKQIVTECPKQRFQLDDRARRIRCQQGHSLKVQLGLTPQKPPEYLYHGTATRFLDAILKQGLVKQQRHHVHLSPDIQTAKTVGSRYGKLVLLQVAADELFKTGQEFYLSGNGVWLTDQVPPIYIKVFE